MHEPSRAPSEGELAARAQREAEHYKDDSIRRYRRGVYGKLLSHIFDNPANKRSLRLSREIIMPGHGGHVLEIGCQAWALWIALGACRPKKLTCINISPAELELGKELARREGARLGIEFEFRVMDAHHLDFADDTFDVVYGGGILHHLDYRAALREAHRVLRPGGVNAWAEPLRLNPLGRALRWLTPRARTVDERPLGHEELEYFSALFDAKLHYFQLAATLLLGVPSSLLFASPLNPLLDLADRADRALLDALPALGPYCRFVVMEGRKRA